MEDLASYKTPGQLIGAKLDERGWNQQTLAIVLGVSAAMINKIIGAKQPVDADMALKISEVLDVPAKRLLLLQKEYDLAQALLVRRSDPGLQMRARLFGDLPVSEMIKRGWIDAPSVRDVPKVEAALIQFFGVSSVDEIFNAHAHAAKKTNVASEATPVQMAWIRRVKQIASEMLVPRYSEAALRSALPLLQALLVAPEEARKVPRILAEAGVRFVLVESLKGAKIDGVCLWLDERSPVIGMSTRFDRIDNFWFVLRHEIEHVLHGHGQSGIMLDAELEGARAGTGPDIAEEERIANQAAAEFCVPQGPLDRFIARKDPVFAERDIIGFARTYSVHPGLVAGQLQRHTGRYNRFRQHLVKIRSAVAPSAVVDGWGDVADLPFVEAIGGNQAPPPA